jgi:hypothetical protein
MKMKAERELDLSKPADIQKAFETHTRNERMLAEGMDILVQHLQHLDAAVHLLLKKNGIPFELYCPNCECSSQEKSSH